MLSFCVNIFQCLHLLEQFLFLHYVYRLFGEVGDFYCCIVCDSGIRLLVLVSMFCVSICFVSCLLVSHL